MNEGVRGVSERGCHNRDANGSHTHLHVLITWAHVCSTASLSASVNGTSASARPLSSCDCRPSGGTPHARASRRRVEWANERAGLRVCTRSCGGVGLLGRSSGASCEPLRLLATAPARTTACPPTPLAPLALPSEHHPRVASTKGGMHAAPTAGEHGGERWEAAASSSCSAVAGRGAPPHQSRVSSQAQHTKARAAEPIGVWRQTIAHSGAREHASHAFIVAR